MKYMNCGVCFPARLPFRVVFIMTCLSKICAEINRKLDWIHALGLVEGIYHPLAFRKGPIVNVYYSAKDKHQLTYTQTKNYHRLLKHGYCGTHYAVENADAHTTFKLQIHSKSDNLEFQVVGINSAIEQGSAYVMSHDDAYGYTIVAA